MESSSMIHINPVAAEAESLWSLALELAQDLGPEREWSLIGGLMVQLHGLEHDDELRDEQLKATEKKWLRKVERALNFEDATLATLFPPVAIERAQQAFRLLSA